jgi:cellulose synthase/poly-beta-1,6-N-acetylglucosamine synthase-like glycosyltransferase
MAKAAQGEWLLFLDADSRLAPNAINRMIAEAKMRKTTFLSCWPKIETQSLSEKLLMPFLNFVVFSLYPGMLSLITCPQFECNPKLGLAHGACMLFARDSYVSFGGHEKVKDQIFEDTRIAQLWRASKRKGICLDGQQIVSLRMYSSFNEIWRGFQKNFFPAFAKERNYWVFMLWHFTGYLLPFLIIIVYPTSLLIYIILTVLLTRLTLLYRFKQSLLSILFHPVGELILILLGLSSWWRCKQGKGVVWKGREYHKRV